MKADKESIDRALNKLESALIKEKQLLIAIDNIGVMDDQEAFLKSYLFRVQRNIRSIKKFLNVNGYQ